MAAKKRPADELSFADIKNYKAELHPVTFLGKKAWIKKMDLDTQELVAEKFQGRAKDEASMKDMKFLVACVLCNSDGKLICPDPAVAVPFFGSIDGDEVVELFNQITDLDLMVKEAEKN